jgi:hypothetical protein
MLHQRFPPPWTLEKPSVEFAPVPASEMIFRLVEYPILGFNFGFEISDICCWAIRQRSADTPRAVFALQWPNSQAWIYVAHKPSMRCFGWIGNSK